MRLVSRGMVVVVFALVLGCQQKDEARPKPVSCTETTCETGVQPGGGTDLSNGGGGGEGGDVAAAGTAEAGQAGELTSRSLRVEARVVNAPEFDLTSASRVTGDVRWTVPGADGNPTTTLASSSAVLEDVFVATEGWVGATPVLAELFPGLGRINLSASAELVVPVVSRSDLDQLAFSLTSPLAVSTDRAQLVVRCVDASGTPVEGVRVGMAGAEALAYDTGQMFSDAETATGPGGIAVGLNLPAVQGSPSFAPVSLIGTSQQQVSVPLQAGFATMAEVVIED